MNNNASLPPKHKMLSVLDELESMASTGNPVGLKTAKAINSKTVPIPAHVGVAKVNLKALLSALDQGKCKKPNCKCSSFNDSGSGVCGGCGHGKCDHNSDCKCSEFNDNGSGVCGVCGHGKADHN